MKTFLQKETGSYGVVWGDVFKAMSSTRNELKMTKTLAEIT